MLSLQDISLFVDSTDSTATESSDKLRIELTDPILTNYELNQLHIGVRSFSFTNLVYNVQATDYLTFYIGYNYKDKQSFVERVDVYIEEGQYSASQIVEQWALQMVTPGNVLESTVINTHNYTVTNSSNMEILPDLELNERSGKLKFTWGNDGDTEFQIPTAEVNDDNNYPYAITPTEIFIPINKNTSYLAYRLGLYKATDTLTETSYSQNTGLLFTLHWDESTVIANQKFQLDQIEYVNKHIFQEQSIQFIDIHCEQVNSFHQTSTENNLYADDIIARIPIIAGFNQIQNCYYDQINFSPLALNSISTLQFTLENPYTSASIFRAPIQFEVIVHEEEISLPDLTETADSQQTYDLPLTNAGDNNTDYLEPSQSYRDPIQEQVSQSSFQMPSNKRSRYPNFF